MAKRIKTWTVRAGLCVSLLVVLAGVYGVDAVDLLLSNRDVVEADGGGGVVTSGGLGEDVLFGVDRPRKYEFPLSSVTLRAISTSNSDQGVIVAIGCDSIYTPLVDSVEFTGTTGVTFRKRFYRVFQGKFHDDSTNVGIISLYHGGSSGGFTSPDSVLVQIPARRTESGVETYTTPAGTSALAIVSWVADVSLVFAGGPSVKVGGNLMGHFIDSTAAGSIALLAREAGAGWREVYSRQFRTPLGVEFVPYRPLMLPMNPGTDLVVAGAVTGAATDINSRLQIGTQ